MENTTSEAALRALEATVDALLDPPGCEWNRAQTHESLVTYLVEETFELVEAIEDGTAADLREELGDVLYQVVLHAGIAQRAGEGFGLAEVMEEVDEKIRRRHPHVFGTDTAAGVDDIVRLWSAAKALEKQSRASAFDGVPSGLPALARAQKIASRADGALTREGDGAGSCPPLSGESADAPKTEVAWGRWLLSQVDAASAHGWDAERALRTAVREREDALRRTEEQRRAEEQRAAEEQRPAENR